MAYKVGVTETINKLPQIAEALEQLLSAELLIGIPSDNTVNTTKRKKSTIRNGKAALSAKPDKDSVGNAVIGYVMENGYPAKNIPARPFLFPTIRKNKDLIAKRLKKAGKLVLSGSEDAVYRELTRLGLDLVAAVKTKITTGPFAPLKPGTLRARRRRGRTGDKPLIDTGQLRNSITYVIRDARDKNA